MSYVVEKEINCLGHAVVNALSRTALSATTVSTASGTVLGCPDRTDRILIQCLSGTFYFSDSPALPTDLVAAGSRISADASFFYTGNRSNFYFLGNALLMFYSAR